MRPRKLRLFFITFLVLFVPLAGCAPIPVQPSPEELPPAPTPVDEEKKPPPKTETEEEKPDKPVVKTFYSNSRLLKISLEIVGGPRDPLEKIELWYSRDDGHTWMRHDQQYPGSESELEFTAPTDGKFAFKIVFLDKDGNRSVIPRSDTVPDCYVLVDTQKPVVIVLSPNGGNIFPNQGYQPVSWNAFDENLDEHSIEIEISPDSGTTWTTIAKGEANDGKYFWKMPRMSSEHCLLRITASDLAGNRGTDTSDAEFVIDGYPPQGEVIGPSCSSRNDVLVSYRAGDVGGAGLARVELYYTEDGGVTWTRYGEDPDLIPPIEFRAMDGRYGLYIVCTDTVGNTQELPSERTQPQAILVIDTQPPQVKILGFEEGGIYRGGKLEKISYFARDDNLMPNSTSLEYTTDCGRNWHPIKEGLPNEGSCDWQIPLISGKEFKLRITSRDTLGNVGSFTTPNFIVDASTPKAVIIAQPTSNQRPTPIPYDIRDFGYSPIKSVSLWFTQDGGKTWTKHIDDHDLVSPVMFSVPDGTYGLRLSCSNELGAGIPPPQPNDAPAMTITIDSSAPSVQLLSFLGTRPHEVYRGGDTHDIEWIAADAHLPPAAITLTFSRDGGKTWNYIVSSLLENTGKFAWTLPRETGSDYRVRVTAVDSFGNEASAESRASFCIDSDPPLGQAFGPAKWSKETAQISYDVQDIGPAGLARVELWYTQDRGKNWTKVGDAREIAGVFSFKVPEDGLYGFALASFDKVGNSSKFPLSAQTAPDFEMFVDTKPPHVQLKNFLGGGIYRGDSTEIVSWSATDENKVDSVTLHVSSDGGITWKELATRLEKVESFRWRLPLETGDRFRIRVTARDSHGNTGVAESQTDFAIDSLPPIVTAKAPNKSTSQHVEILYDVQDFGRAGIRSVILWLSRDNGKTWQKLDEDDDNTPPLIVSLADGTYGIYLSGVDAVGNEQPKPMDVPAALPQLTLVVDSTPPTVNLITFTDGGCFAGGKEYPIRWHATDENLDAQSITLEYSDNGGKTWTVIASCIQNDGEFLWRMPFIDSETCFLRVSARDIPGNRGEVVSQKPFVIDSSPPQGTVLGPAFARHHNIVLQCTASDRGHSGLDRLDLYFTSDEVRDWKLYDSFFASEIDHITFKAEEGRYGLFLIPHDKAGNHPDIPAHTTKPQCVLTIDSTPPRVRARIMEEKPLYGPGDVLSLTWQASDPNLSPTPITIEYSENDGRTWVTVAFSQPGEGTLQLDLASMPSGKNLVRVLATDIAGNTAYQSFNVLVDRTPPLVELLTFASADVYAGGITHNIRWAAVDDNFGPNPISIFFSSDDGKRWKPIATDIENSGVYQWEAPLDNLTHCKISIVAKDAANNVAVATTTESFVIHSTPPSVTISVKRISLENTAHIHYEIAQHPVPIKHVALYCSVDDGLSWEKYYEVSAKAKFIEFSQPDGKYGLYVVAHDEIGLSGREPSPGTPPQAEVIIDTEQPAVALLNAEVLGFSKPAETKTIEWSASDVNLPKNAVSILYAAADGTGWRTIASGQPNRGKLLWKAPPEEGTYAIRVVAKDEANREGYSEVNLVVDSTTPVIKLTSFLGGIFRGGSSQEIRWAVSDRYLTSKPIELHLSRNGGITWETIQTDLENTGVYIWELPKINSTTCLLKVVAKDIAGNITTSISPETFTIDSLPPSAVIKGPKFSKTATTTIHYEAKDPGGAGVAKVELWYRKEPILFYEKYAEFPADSRTIEFTVQKDGLYDLYLVCEDAVGNRSTPPEKDTLPHMSLTVDITKPLVALKNFKGGGVYPGGKKLFIFWEASDAHIAEYPITLLFSSDSGFTWSPIEPAPLLNTGRYLWKLPETTGSAFRIKVVAKDDFGNEAEDASTSDFGIDSRPPRIIEVSGPAATNKKEIEIQYKVASLGPAQVTKVTLYVSQDRGKTWEETDSSPADKPLLFSPEADDKYYLYLVAENEVANRSPAPYEYVEPHAVIIVDRTAPYIALKYKPLDRVFKGGDTIKLSWTLDEVNPTTTPITILMSFDDGQTWPNTIAKNIQNIRSHAVTLPAITESKVRIRVEAVDIAGNTGHATTLGFAIDSSPPVCSVSDIISSTNDFDFEYAASDQGEAGLSNVMLWVSRDKGRTWTKEFEDPDLTGRFRVSFPDGSYWVFAEAVDKIGFSSGTPIPGTPPQATIVVDTVKPQVALKSFTTKGEILRGGSQIDILWEAKDANFEKHPIMLELSADAGKTWEAIRMELENKGSFRWSVPRESGESFMIRITAYDCVGNSASSTSAIFSIDSHPPEATALGPTYYPARPAMLKYSASDTGPAGLDRVDLYFSRDDGKTWTFYRSYYDPADALSFDQPEGDYAIALVGVDRVGNAEPAPQVASDIELKLTISQQPPVIKLTSLTDGGYVRGGHVFRITWQTTGRFLKENPISLYWSKDSGETWELIVSDIADTGYYDWLVPSNSFRHCRLKIHAYDVADRFSVDQSTKDFIIISRAPRSRPYIEGVPKPTRQQGEILIPKKESFDDLLARGIEHFLDDNYTEAEKCFAEAINAAANATQKAWAYRELGYTYYRLNKDRNIIIETFEKAISLDPEYAKPYWDLGNIYFESLQFEKALDFYKKAVNLQEHPEPGLLLQLGATYLRLGRLDNAASVLESALKAAPDSPEAWWYLSRVHLKKNDHEKAKVSLRRVLELFPGDSEYHRTARSELERIMR